MTPDRPLPVTEADETLEQYGERIVATTRKKLMGRLDDDVIGDIKESHLIFGKACAMEAVTTACDEMSEYRRLANKPLDIDELPAFDITKPMSLDQDGALAVAILDCFEHSAGPFTTNDAKRIAIVIQRLRATRLAAPPPEADTIAKLIEDNRALRLALEPFATLAGPINGEADRPTYLEAIEGKDGTGELYLATHFGTNKYQTMWTEDFVRARQALATLQPENTDA